MSKQSIRSAAKQLAPVLKADITAAGPSSSSSTRTQRRFAGFNADNLPFIPTTNFASAPSAYPFSSKVVFPASVTPKPVLPRLHQPRKGWSIIEHLNDAQRALRDTNNYTNTIFHRRHKDRLRAGSIITVTTWTNANKEAISSFSGVLLGVRRRGVDTAFRVRNIVNRVGIEMQYKVLSPILKDIKIVKRAEKGQAKSGSGVRAIRQANAYFLRDRPELLRNLAGALKADRVAVGKQKAAAAAEALRR